MKSNITFDSVKESLNFIELKDYLTKTYVTNKARHHKFEYHVGKERFELTIYCNDKSAIEHADNLGLTLC